MPSYVEARKPWILKVCKINQSQLAISHYVNIA